MRPMVVLSSCDLPTEHVSIPDSAELLNVDWDRVSPHHITTWTLESTTRRLIYTGCPIFADTTTTHRLVLATDHGQRRVGVLKILPPIYYNLVVELTTDEYEACAALPPHTMWLVTLSMPESAD